MPLADMICKWHFLNLNPIVIGVISSYGRRRAMPNVHLIYHSDSRSRSTMVCRPVTP